MFDHIVSITNKELLMEYVSAYEIQLQRYFSYQYGAHLCQILFIAYKYDDIKTAEVLISDPTFCENVSTSTLRDESHKNMFKQKKFIYYVCKNNNIDFLHVLFKNPNILKIKKNN